MIAPLSFGVLLVACAAIELLVPGRPLYHDGWFNVALATLIVFLVTSTARNVRKITDGRARGAAVAAAFAAAIAGFAAIASGLLGPDDQTVIAAPGETVRIDELGGALAFPLVGDARDAAVELRDGSRGTSIATTRLRGSFFLQAIPRTVIAVDASDARGAHLTITQPTGAAFLSPVLLMQGRQTIDGFDVPYDSFDVPALHRSVKAVLFSAEQAAKLPGLNGSQPIVLFDVEDANGAELRGGIGVARSGQRVLLAGLGIRPSILQYPAIRIVSVPNVSVTVAASLLAVAAAALAAAAARRAGSVAPA